MKDCKQSLISSDKLGIKPLFSHIKPKNSSHLLLRLMMRGLPHCLPLDAVASQVLSCDTLNQPKSPQKGLAAHPQTTAWQLRTLPAHWAETPAVSAPSAQNTPRHIHPKSGEVRPGSSTVNDNQGSNLSPTGSCSALPNLRHWASPLASSHLACHRDK